MPQKLSKKNQSVEKVFHIIEVMASNREPMRLQDIANQVKMPASTTLRLVNTMVNLGYARQDPNLRYGLSLKFMKIGSLISSQISIRDIAHPYLVELSTKCEESACIAIEQNMEIVYLDVVDGPDGMLKITQHIGKNAPMHCTGVGKIILQNYDTKEISQMISQKGLPVLTPNTITSKEDLLDEIEKIRTQGYALDNEECELGARCIAAGIKDYSGKVVAAISVSGPISRMTMERIDAIKGTVIESARKVSKLLAYNE